MTKKKAPATSSAKRPAKQAVAAHHAAGKKSASAKKKANASAASVALDAAARLHTLVHSSDKGSSTAIENLLLQLRQGNPLRKVYPDLQLLLKQHTASVKSSGLIKLVLELLAAIDSKQAIRDLIDTLDKTPFLEIQQYVIGLLVRLRRVESVIPLEDVMIKTNKVTKVREAVLDVLAAIKHPQVVKSAARIYYELTKNGDVRFKARLVQVVKAYGESAKSILLADLKRGAVLDRLYAAKLLGEVGDKTVIDALKDVVKSEQGWLKKVAAESALLLFLS